MTGENVLGGFGALAGQLESRPVLLIGTSRDTVTPPAVHHRPVVDAYLARSVEPDHCIFETDHALSDHRVALARAVVGFLGTHVRNPP